jgi:hypothetical protein
VRKVPVPSGIQSLAMRDLCGRLGGKHEVVKFNMAFKIIVFNVP